MLLSIILFLAFFVYSAGQTNRDENLILFVNDASDGALQSELYTRHSNGSLIEFILKCNEAMDRKGNCKNIQTTLPGKEVVPFEIGSKLNTHNMRLLAQWNWCIFPCTDDFVYTSADHCTIKICHHKPLWQGDNCTLHAVCTPTASPTLTIASPTPLPLPPTSVPTPSPTSDPATRLPTVAPSAIPTAIPTVATDKPTAIPSPDPTVLPTQLTPIHFDPVTFPTYSVRCRTPTSAVSTGSVYCPVTQCCVAGLNCDPPAPFICPPTTAPTPSPTPLPSRVSSPSPTSLPSPSPTSVPSLHLPSPVPTPAPTANPSAALGKPSASPSPAPTAPPKAAPTLQPTSLASSTHAPLSPLPTAAPTSVTHQWSCPAFSFNKTSLGASSSFATCGLQVCRDAEVTLSMCGSFGGACSGPTNIRLFSAKGSYIVQDSIAACGQCTAAFYVFSNVTKCTSFSIRQGCVDGVACSGIVAIVSSPNATSLLLPVPSLAPSLPLTQSQSPVNTAVDAGAARGDAISVHTTTVLILAGSVIVFSLVAFYVFSMRRTLERPQDPLKDPEAAKDFSAPLLVPFGLWDCMLTLPLVGTTWVSNMIQAHQLHLNGHDGLAAAIVVIRLASSVVSLYLIRALLFQEWLHKYAEHSHFHVANLWFVVSIFSLMEPLQIRLFPWTFSEFSFRSGGYPDMFIFELVMGLAVATSLSMTALSGTSFVLGATGTNTASLVLSLVSLITAITTVTFKLQAEKINKIDNIFIEKSKVQQLEEENERIKQEATQAMESIARLNAAAEAALAAAAAQEKSAPEVSSEEASTLVKSKAYDTNIKYADENIEVLRKQIENKGDVALEFIPLEELQAELAFIIEQCNKGEAYDERRFEFLMRCLENNPTYLIQRQLEESKWREEAREFTASCLVLMRGFVPPEIFSSTTQQLLDMGIASKELAKRIMQKKCLWLIRMAENDLHRIHEAELWGKYSHEGQGLDIVELAALYAHMPNKLNNEGVGKRKEVWLRRLESMLRSLMAEDKAGRLAAAKARHPTYTNASPPFSARSTLFERTSTVVGDAFGESKRNSWQDLAKGNGQHVKSVAGALSAASASQPGKRISAVEPVAATGSSLDVSAVASVKSQLGAMLSRRSSLPSTTTSSSPPVLSPLAAAAAAAAAAPAQRTGAEANSLVISDTSRAKSRLIAAPTLIAEGAGGSNMEDRRKSLLTALKLRQNAAGEESSL